MLNSQYTFDPAYMKCVSDNMRVLQPFGDVPRKLASSVKRSLVAARALVRALKTGHEIANILTRVSNFTILDLVHNLTLKLKIKEMLELDLIFPPNYLEEAALS